MNYPDQKIQRKVISSLAPDMINVVMMVLGAGVLMGILNGPEDAGMSNAIAQFLVSVIPESLGRYFAVIIAVISAPGTYLLNNDAFYYGVLPPLAATAEAYGFTSLQIRLRGLQWGQAFHFFKPAGTLYLPAHGPDRDHPGPVPGLYLQMVRGDLRDLHGHGAGSGISSGFIIPFLNGTLRSAASCSGRRA